jgi:hypothetical protein
MSRDLRKYARQTSFRLAAGAILLLLVVGDGLIYFFYGSNAAVLGILCILTGLIPVVLVILILSLLDWIKKRADRD